MQKIRGGSLAEVTAAITKTCGHRLSAYAERYEELRNAHPVYGRGGWHAPVTAPHRFMNYVVTAEFAGECDWVWVDIGAYDGALVMMLRQFGVTAYGVELNDWQDMWKLLCVQDYMNVAVAPRVHTISILNYAHSFEPREFLDKVYATYGEPALLLVDREARTPHPNNKLWHDEELLDDLGFSEVLSFPEAARTCIDYGRELLIRRAS